MAVLKSRNASTKITSLTEHTCVTVNESTTTTITATTTTAYITKYVCSATTFGSCFTYYFTVLVLKSYSKSRRVLKTISLPTVEPFYAPPLIGGGIKRCFCLSVCLSVCLSRTSGLSREQRGIGRPKLAQR